MTAPYYSDDRVTLYHGDCLQVAEWLAGDVMVTDPPYGIGWRSGNFNQVRPHKGIAGDEDPEARDAALRLWAARPSVVFGAMKAPQPENTAQVLIWLKPPDAGLVGATLGYRRDIEAVYLVGPWPTVRPPRYSSVIQSQATGLKAYANGGHPHAKPIDLLAKLIDHAPPGVIVDPFAGSGSTLVAAKLTGRTAIGVELEERYCEIAARRLAQEVLW